MLQPKAHLGKVDLARRWGKETPMTRAWIGKRLGIGSASDVSHLLRKTRRDGLPHKSLPV